MSPTRFSAFVVSDDPVFAGALAAALSERFKVQLATLEEARDAAAALAPSVVIVDSVASPTASAIAEIAKLAPTLLLGADKAESMIDAVEAGALGYASREAPFKRVIEAADSVARGVAAIPPLMLGSLLQHVVRQRRLETAAVEQLNSLTPRETEVFELAAVGVGYELIAERLFISPATARTHVHRIFKKLEIHSRAELVALAAAAGVPTTEGS